MLYFKFVKCFLNFIHKQQPVPTLKQHNTPDVFSRFSYKFSIVNRKLMPNSACTWFFGRSACDRRDSEGM